MKDQNIKEVIKDRYGKIARGEQTFCCPTCGPTTTDQCLAVGYVRGPAPGPGNGDFGSGLREPHGAGGP
ncbi:MAG: hypothetical protein M0P73_17540 [Syntrophobacterales bacterium]|nr:hypothetical protein [Syntrophobacterales bacterium]